MATTNDARLSAALDLALKALRSIAAHFDKAGEMESRDAAERIRVRCEAAEALLRGGKS